jgi:hypothetical protein
MEAEPFDPAATVKAGRLPDGVALPAFLIRFVSGVDRHMLERSGYERRTDRISVTVRAVNYRQQGLLIAQVRARCAGQVGRFAGFENVVIDTAGLSPDMSGPGDTYEQAQDFRVAYDAPV